MRLMVLWYSESGAVCSVHNEEVMVLNIVVQIKPFGMQSARLSQTLSKYSF